MATSDERHVFTSFISREAAYRLMMSIWKPDDEDMESKPGLKMIDSSATMKSDDAKNTTQGDQMSSSPEVPKPSGIKEKSGMRCRRVAEVSEPNEDDSSSTISGNEGQSSVAKGSRTKISLEATSTTNESHLNGGEAKSGLGNSLRYKLYGFDIPATVPTFYVLLMAAVFLSITASFLAFQIYTFTRSSRAILPPKVLREVRLTFIQVL